MEDDDADTVLMLVEAFEQQDSDVCDEVFHVVVKEPWKIAMRSGHYLTLQFLDSPSYSAWMMLYTYGNDINFLDATSLTRSSFNRLLRRFHRYYYIPHHIARGRPPKLRYHHQVLG
ncbi:hypothetical protein PI124_g12112 [Phytophthora idaei]|nr:hypothetical protein PI124_g12112 [Phytophthora idaei]